MKMAEDGQDWVRESMLDIREEGEGGVHFNAPAQTDPEVLPEAEPEVTDPKATDPYDPENPSTSDEEEEDTREDE